MPSTRCGWCGRLSNMSPAGKPVLATLPHGGPTAVMGPFSCDYCKFLNLAYLPADPFITSSEFAEFLHVNDDSVYWHPKRGLGKDYSDVPEQIASTASECWESYSIKSYRAAVALARAVVEATAKAKGIKKGFIGDKIDEMASQGMIQEDVRLAAHEIRLSGNEVAHGDLVAEPVTDAEASAVLDLMDVILNAVFQSPAKVARLRGDREGRTSK